eukprot:1158508-Pelagomonas_calceolata.AAC.13
MKRSDVNASRAWRKGPGSWNLACPLLERHALKSACTQQWLITYIVAHCLCLGSRCQPLPAVASFGQQEFELISRYA